MYIIKGYAQDFYTGQTDNGRQVLMGLLCPDVIAYFFAPSGELLHREIRPWEYPAPRHGEDGPYKIYDSEFEKHLFAQISRWQGEIGYHEQAIGVQPFFDEERFVGACEIPHELLDLSDADEDEQEELEEELALWKERKAAGEFVFYWAKDYLMSTDGTVEAT
jgi:hypothetical protein